MIFRHTGKEGGKHVVKHCELYPGPGGNYKDQLGQFFETQHQLGEPWKYRIRLSRGYFIHTRLRKSEVSQFPKPGFQSGKVISR